jgi:hypothetical protein
MKKKPKATCFYMHLMDGVPATFERDCLVYTPKYVRRLAISLKQIRDEQRRSSAFYRERHGADVSIYGYVRIARTALSESE